MEQPSGVVELWRQSLRYASQYPRYSWLMLGASGLDALYGVAFNLGVKATINDAVAHRNHGQIVFILAALAVFFAVANGAMLWRDVLAARVEARLLDDLRLKLLGHLNSLSAEYFARMSLGDLLTRLITDVSTATQALTRSFATLVHRLLQAVTSLAVLLLLDWRLTLLTLAVLPATLVGPRLLVRRLIEARRQQAEHEAAVTGAAQEYLTGHAVIRAFGLRSVIQEAFRRDLQEPPGVTERAGRLPRLLRTATTTGVAFTSFAVTALGIVFVSEGSLSIGSLVGFLGALGLLGQASSRLSDVFPDWLSMGPSLARIDEVLGEQPLVDDAPDARAVPGIQQAIQLAGVRFGYGGDRMVLHDVSLTIPAQRTTAIVGRSGSGKSTVLTLLLRLHDPDAGQVAVDGVDLKATRQESLRSHFGVVFQQPFLFNRSIRDNIRLGRPDASDEEVRQAARLAQIDEVIRTLPYGYDTLVGEGGGKLSGGQRQRIALARALLREPNVLLLDEATSALDPATEAAFEETLREVARSRTVIAVTHRLASVTDFDHIIVMDNGKVAEEGTHTELLARGGVYRSLWEQQAGFVVSGDGASARISPERLRRIPLFADVSNDVLERLATRFVPQHYRTGEHIINEGEIGDTFYVLVRGVVDVVSKNGDETEHQYRVLEDGDFFGEIALLDNVPRSATVRARIPTLVLALSRDSFNDLLESAPALRVAIEEQAAIRLQRVPDHWQRTG